VEHCNSHCSFSASRSVVHNDQNPTKILEIPSLLSLLATNHLNGQVQGINQLQAQYVKEYGPGNYVPTLHPVLSMRVMAYLAAVMLLFSLWGRGCSASTGWPIRNGSPDRPWRWRTFLMNTAGWMLAENGRQPWIVQAS